MTQFLFVRYNGRHYIDHATGGELVDCFAACSKSQQGRVRNFVRTSKPSQVLKMRLKGIDYMFVNTGDTHIKPKRYIPPSRKPNAEKSRR